MHCIHTCTVAHGNQTLGKHGHATGEAARFFCKIYNLHEHAPCISYYEGRVF